MNSAQNLSTAVKSVVNGFRPISDSVSLDTSSTSDVDTLLTFALTARSLDQASSALERVLELDADNEVANAGFTWLLGVRDAAERLEQSIELESAIDDESNNDVEVEGIVQEACEDDAVEATAGDTVKEPSASSDSGFSSALPFAFQQVVEPLIASTDKADDCGDLVEAAAQAEQEEKERAEAEAEAAARAEQEEKERAEAEAAAQAEQEEKERAEAEAAAQAEQEEKERAEAEAAARGRTRRERARRS